jgi:hypothetical protein
MHKFEKTNPFTTSFRKTPNYVGQALSPVAVHAQLKNISRVTNHQLTG